MTGERFPVLLLHARKWMSVFYKTHSRIDIVSDGFMIITTGTYFYQQ